MTRIPSETRIFSDFIRLIRVGTWQRPTVRVIRILLVCGKFFINPFILKGYYGVGQKHLSCGYFIQLLVDLQSFQFSCFVN